VSSLVLTNTKIQIGTAWTGTAPGPSNPTVSGTITTPTDFSDHTFEVQLGSKAAMQDFTTFGDNGFYSQKPGLLSSDLTVNVNQDFAASSVDVTFGPGILARTLFYIDVMPTSAARSATNPSYVYAAYLMTYNPVGQSVGNKAAAQLGFSVTGTYARLTA
jgi:hypothetical protein